ncbi:unnamed protein product [Linum trigynum]|uniref:Transposase-associated domain-containing protein n=1 Tax=Linum trigynum TaxID=586398 RepID=A0AAV2E8V2_9ROSI
MDRGWLKHENRFSANYVKGVEYFVGVSKACVDGSGRIRCPCRKCNNCCFKTIDLVKADLFLNGMVEDYSLLIYHREDSDIGGSGETDNLEDTGHNDMHGFDIEMPSMLNDLSRANAARFGTSGSESMNEGFGGVNQDPALAKLLKDANCPLYPGCKKFSKLSFIMKMMNNKMFTNSSDKAFKLNLDLIKEALPNGENLPNSYYEVKRYIHDLGFGYTIIDAWPNNCALFRGPFQNEKTCPKCKKSRYKPGIGKDIPIKTTRYFPIKDRLLRLFMTKEPRT